VISSLIKIIFIIISITLLSVLLILLLTALICFWFTKLHHLIDCLYMIKSIFECAVKESSLAELFNGPFLSFTKYPIRWIISDCFNLMILTIDIILLHLILFTQFLPFIITFTKNMYTDLRYIKYTPILKIQKQIDLCCLSLKLFFDQLLHEYVIPISSLKNFIKTSSIYIFYLKIGIEIKTHPFKYINKIKPQIYKVFFKTFNKTNETFFKKMLTTNSQNFMQWSLILYNKIIYYIKYIKIKFTKRTTSVPPLLHMWIVNISLILMLYLVIRNSNYCDFWRNITWSFFSFFQNVNSFTDNGITERWVPQDIFSFWWILLSSDWPNFTVLFTSDIIHFLFLILVLILLFTIFIFWYTRFH